MKSPTLEKLLDSTQAAEMLGVCNRTVLNRAAAGLLPYVKLPGSTEYRFRPSRLAQFITEHEHEPKAA